MVIIYKSAEGSIRMDGGGGGKSWRVYEITGIGFPKKSFTYNTYAGVYGQELNAVSMNSRTITISGDISKTAQANLPMTRVVRILNGDGELFLQTGRKIRRAKVRTVSFETEERRSAFKSFVLQVESDNPFFFGDSPSVCSVFSREKLLKTTFTLPCVFSERHMEAAVINGGDVECEPVLTISKPSGTEALESGVLSILNGATGKKVTLEHIMQPGEVVTVNIPERTVVSNLAGNIINEISDDTVLGEFVLLTGSNPLSCASGDASLSVLCEFETLYLEGSHDE